MDAGRRYSRNPGRVVLLLALIQGTSLANSPDETVTPLIVRDGCCECVLPTTSPTDKFYLVVGSVAHTTQSHEVTIHTEACAGPARLPQDEDRLQESDCRRLHELHERLARSRQSRSPIEEYPPSESPPLCKSFHLFVGEQNFQDAAAYVTIHAELQLVGKHCQAYLDRDCTDRDFIRASLEDAVRAYDDEIQPRARRELGRVVDVDKDGRFTLLFTPWLGKLANGRTSIGGCVRGSDFYRDIEKPFGNRCDMMYLNTNLRPGAHLRAILAHEYTHAVVFSEHVLGNYLPDVAPRDEEGWLNEALAHHAEEANGYGWSNLDYRVGAFLNAPERYHLVVPDYYAAGLWRSPGHRGATYLFLRWCREHCGPNLIKRLVQSSLSGTDNIEAETRERFADLFRQWSLALLLDGTHLPADACEKRPDYHLWNPRRPLGSRFLCGPSCTELSLDGAEHEVKVAGTGVAYFLLHSPVENFSRLRIQAEPAAELQATLVRLPERTARLSLRHEVSRGKDRAVRLFLTANHGDVHLEGAAWERLTPPGNGASDLSYTNPSEAIETARTWFGDPLLKAGVTRTSPPIYLPATWSAGEEWTFKVSAVDLSGHRLSAWTVIGTGHKDHTARLP